MPQRTIAIGDIHGCATALRSLLEWLDIQPDDTLVPLGDYVDRGPDTRDVLDQLIDLADRCRLVPLLGNHEEMLLAALEDPNELDMWLPNGGLETLRSYGPTARVTDIPAAHLEFIHTCRDYHETDTHFFVHANYVEHIPLARQSQAVLRWESIRYHHPGPHVSGKTAIVGHTRQYTGEILDLGHVKCIDTNACGGKWLTALDVATGRVWQTSEEGLRRE